MYYQAVLNDVRISTDFLNLNTSLNSGLFIIASVRDMFYIPLLSWLFYILTYTMDWEVLRLFISTEGCPVIWKLYEGISHQHACKGLYLLFRCHISNIHYKVSYTPQNFYRYSQITNSVVLTLYAFISRCMTDTMSKIWNIWREWPISR